MTGNDFRPIKLQSLAKQFAFTALSEIDYRQYWSETRTKTLRHHHKSFNTSGARIITTTGLEMLHLAGV